MGTVGAKEVTLKATIENVGTVTEFVEAELESMDCPIKAQMQIAIAIDELFSNIAKYAYTEAGGEATVRVVPLEGAVEITFIDRGTPFNPLAGDDPDLTLSVEERGIGGLGVFMVKKTMDAMDYVYEDGQNILRIVKNIA